ncbi:MAG: sigma factor-like helix-turn-helix DNA-binding protein, partial [Myxococcota bacterium]|nr:sigma factor-like helix-turn-helix DNA-binding protein [Myxococcota bacterium]
WIQQAVVRAIQKQARTVRLPSHVSERLRRMERARSELIDTSADAPSDADVAHRAGLEAGAVEELRRASQPLLSLDAPGPDDRAPLSERLGDPDPPSLAEAVHQARLADRLGGALSQLDSREAAIIRRRFGLADDGPATLEDVGYELGLSRERTRQIEQGALAKMRRWATDRGLRDGGSDGTPA